MEHKKRNKGELAIGVVCILLGFLLAVQLKSVKVNAATDATASRLETLQGLYNQAQSDNESLKSQIGDLQSELALYRGEAADGADAGAALKSEIERLEMLLGLTDLQGEGVQVVLSDSAAPNLTGNEANYIIHDSDLLSVINELRDAGAEAIALNGERLLATSEIRCTGAVVSVNGRRYAAPFVVTAIGDSATLYNALTMRNGVVDVLGQWGITVKVTAQTQVLIPKYTGGMELRYAQSADQGPDAGEENGE